MKRQSTKTVQRWNCVNGIFALLPLSLLIIDENKQRARRPHWLEWLRKNWKAELCGVCAPMGTASITSPMLATA